MIGCITGSGCYDLDLKNKFSKVIKTEYGFVEVTIGTINDIEIAFIARHKEGHKLLPNMINHRANLLAFKELGVDFIVSTTVCGALKKEIKLAKLVVFDDLFFPDNRLPGGDICSIYTKEGDKKRGHLIFDHPFNQALRNVVIDKNSAAMSQATYAHANGPRFNTKSEIKYFANYADCVSQTAGPELILAGELEIPIVLLGFTIDYANGVSDEPTPISVLQENLNKSKEVFSMTIQQLCTHSTSFDKFVYRFEQ